MRILELGSYIVPAYAGMLLAEQGHTVTKWTNDRDPILGLHRGAELWQWLNDRKSIEQRDLSELLLDFPDVDIVIDNIRPATLARFGIDPALLAQQHSVCWVSMRDELGDRSFDLLAQCRSWMEYSPWVPFYAGDTTGGLWLAFKALNGARGSHSALGHASCMQKLVEGELLIDIERDGISIPWDAEEYRFADGCARVEYKGTTIVEQPKDRIWKLAHLWHTDGRIKI